MIIMVSVILSFSVLFIIYRIYRAQQLNLQLESFMAEQIIPIQDKWFEAHGRSKQDEYFIHRIAPFYVDLGKAAIDGSYSSYWLSRDGSYQQLLIGEWYRELAPDEQLTWVYLLSPLSDSIVCVSLEAHKPKSWTAGGMGSVAGSLEWTVDTSKAVWQLKPYDSSCPYKDLDLLRITLLPVY